MCVLSVWWGVFARACTVHAGLWPCCVFYTVEYLVGAERLKLIISLSKCLQYQFFIYRQTWGSTVFPCRPWRRRVLFFSSLTSLPCSRCKLIAVARGWKSLTRGCPGTGVRLLNGTRKELYLGVTPLRICPGAPPLCLCALRLDVISLRTGSPALDAANERHPLCRAGWSAAAVRPVGFGLHASDSPEVIERDGAGWAFITRKPTNVCSCN